MGQVLRKVLLNELDHVLSNTREELESMAEYECQHPLSGNPRFAEWYLPAISSG